ncbi:MAG: hypothetical protein A3B10_01645 [Candidatus Doudnabacteria bacterium RIFCSPLOWO2_01_FULL_44_21]|uniref:Uncharacterized protein n=1 Tax=Candidatus Doudnabacteria bacterium RIFCSPLOWO2_01_FULL_44_21 TaxID=1817841 RepID=A0A1F5Q2R2_9BACT|nr:MAG: hypothetical protein A3B10_01645 [Candidatus Doudnabacteria bacterium RIFCSPLOWO2_01_FULL_44_21]
MNNNEVPSPENVHSPEKKSYRYEIERNGGVNATTIQANSFEQAEAMANADLQERKFADPDADYKLHHAPYETDLE